MGDQPFWGKRVRAVGAGSKPILVRNLSVEALTEVIVEAENDSLRKRVQVIGEQIQREDGTDQAVQWIEKYSNNFHRSD